MSSPKEASPNPSERRGASFLLFLDDVSEGSSALSPFRGSWRGLEAFPVTALHVTRYIFAYGVFVGRQGGYSLLLYKIYKLYIIIILFIF